MEKTMRCGLSIIIISLVLVLPSNAQDDYSIPFAAGWELSGFFDLQYHLNSGGASSNYQWGQVELDLCKKLSHCISIEAAIAYDREAEAFGVGAAFIEYNIFGEEQSHFIRSRHVNHSGIIAGQFDMPFGIDWRIYPSLDRKTISEPLIIEETHGAWNDLGVIMFAEGKWMNMTAFHTAFSDPSNPDQTNEDKNGFIGGRIGFTPLKGLEVGASYAGCYLSDQPPKAKLAGGDIIFSWRNWELRGEFIRADYSVILWPEKAGGYIQGTYKYRRFSASYRWDRVEIGGAPTVERHCGGLGWILCGNAEIRSEYQYEAHNGDKFMLQAVAGI